MANPDLHLMAEEIAELPYKDYILYEYNRDENKWSIMVTTADLIDLAKAYLELKKELDNTK